MDNIYLLSDCSVKRGWFPIEIDLEGDPRTLYYFVLTDVLQPLPGGRHTREVKYLLMESPPPPSKYFVLDMSFFVSGQWWTANDGTSFWEINPVSLKMDKTEEYLRHFFDGMDRGVVNSIFSIIFTQIDKERHPDLYSK